MSNNERTFVSIPCNGVERRGINLGGALDGPPRWEVRGEHLDAIAAAGFGAVRLPVRWWEHAGDVPPFALDGAFLERVARVVEAAWARGMPVVLTMHHAHAAGGAPDKLCALWRQIAARFAGASGALAFELLNEPRAPITSAHWNALLPRVLAAVREVDPERPVVVGGADMSTVPGLLALELPPAERLVATFHYYEPFHFTHQGASWEPGSEAWLATGWGTQEDRAAVTADLERAAAWARERGVALYAGEFGAFEAAAREARVRWTGWVRRELERLEIPWAYWDFGTDFGAYDLAGGGWREDILDALVGV